MAAITMLARAQLRRSLRTMLVLAVLAGVTAGIVLGCAQLARRTSTAHARLEQATNVPDAALLSVGGEAETAALLELPQIDSAWVVPTGIAQVAGNRLRFVGVLAPEGPPPPGLFTPVIVEGRAPNPNRADEIVLSEFASEHTGFEVGDTLGLKFLTAEEFSRFDTGFGEPDGPKVDMRVVGISRTAIDRGLNSIETFSTPALAELLGDDAAPFPTILVRLREGTTSLPAFQRAARDVGASFAPPEGGEEFAGVEVQVPSRQRPVLAVTARVQVIGIVVFAAVAGIAGFLGVGLALRRHLQVTVEPDLPALGAIGASTREIRAARLLAAAPFVIAGTIVGVGVAAGLGVLGPIGSMGAQEPHPGWQVNFAILAVGAVAVLAVMVLLALLSGPVRVTVPRGSALRTNAVAERLAAAGAPPAAVVGTRMALSAGRGRTAVPVRSTLAVTSFGVLGLVALVVFAASLDRLVDTPSRWGWEADALVIDVQPDVTRRLVDDERVVALSIYEEFQVIVEGRGVGAEAFTDRKRSVGWTVTRGRAPSARGEILLGARLARELDRSVGDRVDVRRRRGGTVSFEVTGIGTGPNLTNQQFGGGVVISRDDMDRVRLNQPFVNASVELADGVSHGEFTSEVGRDLESDGPARPPDVDNLTQLGALPQLLVGFLALVGVAVLTHLLVTTTRRRRRDLDTLRAMGFVPRQAGVVIAIVAVVTMGIGLVVGIPLGVAAGRFGWELTARAIYVADDPVVPVLALFVLGVAALVAAVGAAAWPAWRVAHGPAAAGLRDE